MAGLGPRRLCCRLLFLLCTRNDDDDDDYDDDEHYVLYNNKVTRFTVDKVRAQLKGYHIFILDGTYRAHC